MHSCRLSMAVRPEIAPVDLSDEYRKDSKDHRLKIKSEIPVENLDLATPWMIRENRTRCGGVIQ